MHKGEQGAGQEKVHAENQGIAAVEVRLGFGQRQIARSCGMGVGTVHLYLERAAAAEVRYFLFKSQRPFADCWHRTNPRLLLKSGGILNALDTGWQQ